MNVNLNFRKFAIFLCAKLRDKNMHFFLFFAGSILQPNVTQTKDQKQQKQQKQKFNNRTHTHTHTHAYVNVCFQT